MKKFILILVAVLFIGCCDCGKRQDPNYDEALMEKIN